jgi:flagellum-specific peptidoglycan hydrolase FlgJ
MAPTTIGSEPSRKPQQTQPAPPPGLNPGANLPAAGSDPGQSQPASGFVTGGPARAAPLKEGSRGPEVMALQNQLNQLGYQAGTADGVFGSSTRAALKDFQTQNRLTPDGIAGPATQRALNDPGAVRAPANLTPRTGNAFIDRVSADAIQSQRATGVPASVTIAQAILESGWGKSGLSTKAHNYFGIKGEGPAGHVTMRTREVYNGREVYENAKFRKYNSPAESFIDHGRFLRDNPRYAKAFKHTDNAERFAAEIHKAGYATDPNYTKLLTGIIRQHDLTRFDRMASAGGTPSPIAPTPTAPTAPPTTPAPESAPSSPSLAQVASGQGVVKLGQEGESVRQVQQMLGMTGADVDGKFGSGTEMAVRGFQRKNGLEVDGIVGPRTFAALTESVPLLKEGASGERVEQLQQQLKQAGFDPGGVDGKFGRNTEAAVKRFQEAKGLEVDGIAGPRTLGALLGMPAQKPESPPATPPTPAGTGGLVLGNGLRIDTSNPILRKLATSPLDDGPTGYCVVVTRENMDRLGVPHPPGATGNDPNNPRGAMVQMLRNGGWESVPLPGSRQETIRSPYGTATANVVSAEQYKRLVAQGKIPDGAIIFQTRHGWGWNKGSSGNDMGIVRDNGRTTHNYRDMSSIIYSDCKDVVILVPKGALVRTE